MRKARRENLEKTFDDRKSRFKKWALEFWNDFENRNNSRYWMEAYDYVFKFVIEHPVDQDSFPELSNSQIVYDVYTEILRDRISDFDEASGYIARGEFFIRTAAYIHRFFVPHNKLTPLGDVFKKLVVEKWGDTK